MFRELFLTLLLFTGFKNTCGISYPVDEHSQADFYLQFESHRDNYIHLY